MPQFCLSSPLSATSLFAALLCAALPSFAHARSGQSTDTQPSVFDGDYLTIGIGGGIGPSCEGSDDYVAIPFGALQGEVGGIGHVF